MRVNDGPRSCLKDGNKRHLLVEFVHTGPILQANNGTSILPSIHSSLLQVHKEQFPKEETKKVPCKHENKGQVEFLPKDSNFEEIDEESIQESNKHKLPWVDRYLIGEGDASNPLISLESS